MTAAPAPELWTTVHRVTCPRLGEMTPPADVTPCDCPRLDLLTLVPPEVFGAWVPGAWYPARRTAALLEGARAVGGVCSAVEFLLAAVAQVPAEVRGSVVGYLVSAREKHHLDEGAVALLTASLFEPSR